MTSASNPIHFMNTLPPDMVRELAYAAQGLAATHEKSVARWPWPTTGRGLVRCDKCEHTWVKGHAKHALWCPVGRTQEMAAKVLAFALPQRRRDDAAPIGTAEFIDTRTRRGNEIAFPSNDERSDGRTEQGRPGGNPAELAYQPAPSYQEPWAWDPKHNAVVDRNGNTVADMVSSDLSVLQQEEFGLRIAICVNYFKGSPNEWLRDTKAALNAAKQAVVQ